jgi:hypothetical protein
MAAPPSDAGISRVSPISAVQSDKLMASQY